MIRLKILFGIIISLFLLPAAKGQESVLRSGNWYKVSVDHRGVFKINYDLLKKMGINPDKIDPRKIKIYGNGGGMLPQANNTPRPYDLVENSIFINGESDGKFNKQDFILFYAEGADKIRYDLENEIFVHEKNLYDDLNYYFLTIAETNGKRVGENSSGGVSSSVIYEFDDFVYHESDEVNELHSGREWSGENFNIETEKTFKLDLKGITENSAIKITSEVMAQSYTGSSFNLLFNGTKISEQVVAPISNSQYETKGRYKHNLIVINSNDVAATQNTSQELRYQYNRSTGYSKGYLNYFEVNCKRKLALYSNQTIFSSFASLQNDQSTFEIFDVPVDGMIWEITNPLESNIQLFDKVITAQFTVSTTELRQFIIFNADVPSPKLIGKVDNQNLHGLTTPNLVVVVYPEYKSEALRFANHRQSHNTISVTVVTTDQVFNEFSSGRKDVSAIRDFAKFLYDKSPSTLKSLLLFGRSSYDYKDRLYYNTNFVPTYESRNSLDPLSTYSSDDYFGFFEDNEGEWEEYPAVDNTLDIGVGRFPVKNLEEAQTVVNKIIAYETGSNVFGNWRKEIVFVADDGDNNEHQKQSDKLALKVETSHPEFNARRIFLDSYQQIVKPSGEFSPETNQAIQDAIDRGSVIINYTGHGGEKIWAQEKIFDNLMIDKLDNKVYPLFVTATCVFGRNDDPEDISSAELGITKKNGGAIGMVTTARPVSSNTNFELNQAFYDALFIKESNSYLTLGEVFRRTKNNSTSGVSNRNFSLLGDPSMKLPFPENKIEITEIVNDQGTDSLKALSTITVRGNVKNDQGTLVSDFSGTLHATLFDKQASFTTLGNENPPYTFKQWYNALFRGTASVIDGSFEFQFVVPKNISYQVGNGKLSLYASNFNNDAMGVDQDFGVGKSTTNPGNDNTSPLIQAYMGDESFVDGGLISSNSYLVAKLSDENGLNISGYGIGNSIMGILDGESSFVLNDYYTADKDSFKSGRISFRMKDLAPGKHTIVIKAWDTYNNPAEASVHFTVSESSAIQVESFGNYPNPFKSETTLFFTHNKPGEDLEGMISIYDLTGQLVKTFNFDALSSNYRVEIPIDESAWETNKKLQAGLYLARLIVRSISNGSKNEQVTKLIILN